MVIGNADNQRGICGKAKQADAQERAGSALEKWEEPHLNLWIFLGLLR